MVIFYPMFDVTIVGFDQAYASAITGAMDVFSLAGMPILQAEDVRPQRRFRVRLASLGGGPVQCTNKILLQSHCALESVRRTDLLLVPTIGGNVEQVLARQTALYPQLQRFAASGCDIASNCSGAFLLAEAGLLDGREATTHWAYTNLFQQRYPQVRLRPEKLITSQEPIFCAGGGMAWLDLSMLLLERFCGHEVALETAKTHVLDLSRGMQAAYAPLRTRKYHDDAMVREAQEWLESHFAEKFTLEELARRQHLSPRTFIRRFRQATGETPLSYLQALRMEAAKKALESSQDSLDQILMGIGYEDPSSFTRLFKRHCGLSPSQYRKKFRRL